MSRRYRHHRKLIHQAESQPVIDSATPTNTEEFAPGSMANVYPDLIKSAVLIGVMLIILIGATALNGQQHWTLKLGDWLYQLLHIR